MTGRLWLVVLAVGMIALAVVGCGGGESDEDKVTSAIEDAYSAFADGDAASFCEQLSSDYRGDFEEYYGGCDNATIGKVLGDVEGAEIDQLENPVIAKVRIRGDSAETAVNGDDLEVIKEGDDWKLDDFDVPGGS